ncbi:MAG: hypothetical protein WD021_09145 [Rhodothermales bacterium]
MHETIVPEGGAAPLAAPRWPSAAARLVAIGIVIVAMGCGERRAIDDAVSDDGVVEVAQPSYPPGYVVFGDDRFGYSFVYPDTLLALSAEDSVAGVRRFVSPESTVVLTASAERWDYSEAVPAAFRERIRRRQSEGGVVTYSTHRDSSFVVSGTVDARIYYEKSIFYDSTSARIVLTYPIGMRSAMDSVVTHISHSFGGRIW